MYQCGNTEGSRPTRGQIKCCISFVVGCAPTEGTSTRDKDHFEMDSPASSACFCLCLRSLFFFFAFVCSFFLSFLSRSFFLLCLALGFRLAFVRILCVFTFYVCVGLFSSGFDLSSLAFGWVCSIAIPFALLRFIYFFAHFYFSCAGRLG